MKKTDFLKDCMADAVVGLLKTHRPEEITAAMIAERAGVGRATWFRHFSSKEEAVSFKLQELWYEWVEQNSASGADLTTLERADLVFRFFYQYKDLHLLLISRGMNQAIYHAFFNIIIPPVPADSFIRYDTIFYMNGLYGLVMEWLKTGLQESPKEMSAAMHRIFAAGYMNQSSDV